MRAETPLAISAGARLGNYEIVTLIGEGAMGEVYRAHDPRLRRDVAIKVLHSSATAGAAKLRRFEQEAQAAGMLNHPNLLTIYELGVHDGSPFIVSELLEGESLRARLQRGPVPPAEALNTAVQVVRGLAAAHAKGIVHRDLKPENLFITTEGRVKILDFGLAKLTDEATPESCTVSQMTNPGAIVGTFSYMSPEQATAGVIDARSDLFSLGSIIFEMLCGRRAFAGASPTETLAAILTVDPLEAQPKEISAAVAAVLRRCLAKSQAQRFASADDLVTALQVAQTGSAAPMHHAALLRRAGVVAIAVLALGAAATIGLRSQRAPSRHVASIAVLPLVDLSGGQRDPDFADGMTDELITHLAQIRALRVISPAST
ncbi:MAG TPA: serine/threonine-protein kinase, partial [Thermoanaerobaculia bacterium]